MSNAPVPAWGKLNRAVGEFVSDESGVTSIEYALIGSLIAVVIVISVGNVGAAVRQLYDLVETAVVAVL